MSLRIFALLAILAAPSFPQSLVGASVCGVSRSCLQNAIFGAPGIPSDAPTAVNHSAPSVLTGTLATEIHVQMATYATDGHAANAYCYLHEVAGSDELTIIHQGHAAFDHAPSRVVELTNAIIGAGSDVLLMNMVGIGGNQQSPGLGHNGLSALDFPSPFWMHMYPIAVCLGYAIAQREYDDINMTGHSGGGWAATVYAAMDSRIDTSIELMGTLPVDLRGVNNLGDYEQQAIVNWMGYRGMYYLAGDAIGRKRVQILNATDQCCFAKFGPTGAYGTGYESAVIFALDVISPGDIVFHEVAHQGHTIVDETISLVLMELGL